MDHIIQGLQERNPNAVVLVGFNDCLIGTLTPTGGLPVAVYSTNMIIEKMVENGMDEDSAWENYFFNIEQAPLGKYSPMMFSLEVE